MDGNLTILINNKESENIINGNILFKEKKNIETIPPKNISFKFNNEENNQNFNFYKKDFINNNNIIFNNINVCNYNIILANNNILFPRINNQINSQSIFNCNIISNNSIKNKGNLSKIHSKPRKVKLIFGLSSDIIDKTQNKKRGRKSVKLKNNRIHRGFDDDNLRKIQVHFLSFIINFVKDIIKSLIGDKDPPLFKNLDYKIKKISSHKYIVELKSKKIADILKLRVSPKLKVHGENVNKIIYSKICNILPFMTDFFEKTYLDLFKEYYFDNNKLILLYGKFIRLSKKTKTFSDLIIKNYKYKEKLRNVAIKNYLKEYKCENTNNNSYIINSSPKLDKIN